MEMARAALHCVGSHVPEKTQPGFWSKMGRLRRHADRCYDVVRAMHIECEDANMLHSLGRLCYTQGRFKEAEAMYTWALQEQGKTMGPECRKTLQTVNNLGALYYKKGRLEEAEVMLKK